MARIHGRAGRLYAGIASGGTAEPIAFIKSITLDFKTDDVDVTAWGDSNKTYASGLPDGSGSFDGFYDAATAQLYTAATDGVARKWYWYPDTGSTGQYWFGTALFDFSVSSSVDGAVEVSGDFKAASLWSKVG